MNHREKNMPDDAGVGAITFTGLGSGTDFESMVTKLVQVESFHKQKMESWRSEWESKNEALNILNTEMLNLKTSLKSLDSMNEFLTKSVSSNMSEVLSATADATAEEGAHSVEINQLASNQIITANAGFANATSKVNQSGATQTFSYAYRGKDYSINVADGSTLTQLVNSINSDPKNAGVRASLVSDGTSQYLQLRGLDMGSNATLSFNASLSTLSNAAFNDAGDFTVTQYAQSSQIKVDGWPTASNAWINTNSNTISGVIQGLSFNLKSLGSEVPTTVTVSVNTDYDAVKDNIRSFVDGINTIRSMVVEMTEFDESSKRGSIMTGNYAVQLVDSQLKQATANIGQGFLRYNVGPPPTGDKLSSLAQLGILTDASEGSPTKGQLVIDEEILDDILNREPQAVAELFAASFDGGERVDSGNFSFGSGIKGVTAPGVYDVTYTVSGGAITGAFIDGLPAQINNEDGTITSTRGNSKGIVVTINDFPSDSTGSGVVRIRQGKAGEMADLLGNLTNGESGPLNILQDNYDDIIENITDKIAYEETRLLRMEKDLRLKFARLESLLGQYDQQNQSLQSSLGQLE